MSLPIPFQVANQIGNNFAQAREQNSIEKILSESVNSGDPQVLQNNIGKILSQVSPERQGPALQYLQKSYENVINQQKQAREQQAATAGGYTYGAPPAVQAQQVKSRAKQDRLNQYGLGGNFNTPNVSQQALDQNTNSAEIPNTPDNTPASPSADPFDKYSDSQLQQLAGNEDKEVADYAKAKLQNRLNADKQDRADKRDLRKETLPLRMKYIERANLSRESIRNKNHLINLIDTGKIDDPTFAILAENLPFNLGKRLLSNETVEYKGGLVDEFADLKNIFKGATRVKEVEIYENKLADLYLNDAQKKGILKSRINGAKADIILEEAAQQVEEKFPNLSALQFDKKVQEIAQPKLNSLFNSIWDEQKAILDQAESRKSIPLDPDDPEDAQIAKAIYKEAGSKDAARKLAKKKGYTL